MTRDLIKMQSLPAVNAVLAALGKAAAKGLDANSLKEVGFDAQELKAAGFDAASLKGAGFDLSSLVKTGFDAAALKGAGFSIRDIAFEVGSPDYCVVS